MRDIKFKAKRVDNGKWVEGDLVHGSKGYKASYIFVDFEDDDDIFEDSVHEVNPETVCQYTGLKDKNGKEIYEGDKIRCIAMLNDHNQKGAEIETHIIEHGGNMCLACTLIPYYPFCISHDIEVIGSIHDKGGGE